MGILRERNELDKKWTWYLFLLANVCVLIGAAASWMMIARGASLNLLWLPIVICNIVAIVLTCVFMWLEAKEIMPKAHHFQKKWLWWYLTSLIIFVVAILFEIIYYLLMIQMKVSNEPGYIHTLRSQKWILIVFFVITGVLTLTSIAFQRYARFRIDLDVLRRKRGENPKAEEAAKEAKKDEEKKSQTIDSDPKASGGLLDEIDKK